eukprot:TRINITY_DN2247_c0_g1_i1.p1 TRINITY_DN2247_c0_g1~~TRINITY_DN2247_c0_g1_i1.p1  ORF type:complete len:333 (-),score=25.15 TRINITY_DN2247_c0_g1_i1:320-1282(-)
MASKHSFSFVSVLLLQLILLSFTRDVQSRPTLSIDRKKGAKPTAFQFLENLVGFHKGQRGKGVHELTKYLEKFGYLKYGKVGSNQGNDIFDDLLESAIKKYQLNYHLNDTGVLDIETASLMMVPRCGVPDVIHGGVNHYNDTSNLPNVSDMYSFFPGNPRWPSDKTTLTYGFVPNGLQVVAMNDFQTVCSKAFDRWSAASNGRFNFQEIGDSSSADIKIGFFSGEHGDYYPFDGPSGILGHSFAPQSGVSHFDADEPWAITVSTYTMDLESVVTHEFGHLLGLGHSSSQEAIMYPYISRGIRKVELSEDDIEGIQTLYGV